MFFILTISVNTVFCEEQLSYLEGKLSFQRPAGVTLWEERPQLVNAYDYTNFWNGRIMLSINVYDTEAIKKAPKTLMSQSVYDLIRVKDYLSRDAMLNLFNTKSEFVVFDYIPRIYIRKSYKQFFFTETTVGETAFHVYALNLEAVPVYGYIIYLIVDNKIVNISLSLSADDKIYESNELEKYVKVDSNKYYWRGDQSIFEFYETLNSKNYKTLPEPLQQLREAYEIILNTLEIQQDNANKNNITIIEPKFDFQKTHVALNNLHLLERDDVNAPIMQILAKGEGVQVIGAGGYNETIGGITAPWLMVTTKNGIAGWCFSGYLLKYE